MKMHVKLLREYSLPGRWLFFVILLLSQSSLQPHGLQHTRLPCPSPSPRACSNSCLFSWWCHPTIISSVVLLSSCLQSFPTSGRWLCLLLSRLIPSVWSVLQRHGFQHPTQSKSNTSRKELIAGVTFSSQVELSFSFLTSVNPRASGYWLQHRHLLAQLKDDQGLSCYWD